LRIVIVYNTTSFVFKTKTSLIHALQSMGHTVYVVAPQDAFANELKKIGVNLVEWELAAYGTNPFSEAQSIIELNKILKVISPAVVFSYTVKPNIYGGIVCANLKIPHIANIAGIGRILGNQRAIQGFFSTLVLKLYSFGLRKSRRIFFQNEEDRELFINQRICKISASTLIPGSGVDLNIFLPRSLNKDQRVNSFIFVGRLLELKGIGVLYKAAQLLSREREDFIIHIVGEHAESHGYISQDDLNALRTSPFIKFHGSIDPRLIPSLLRSMDCAVLPSNYGEGVPRSLLEALSTGLAIITTDSPGCRETVIASGDQQNGYLVAPEDPQELALAINKYLDLGPESKRMFSDSSRKLAELKFDEKIVIEAYKNEVMPLLGETSGCL
jgi:glycosyltransferase involved in cell wall biosynthesis